MEEDNFSKKIRHNTATQRKHYRLTIPIDLIVEGKSYRVKDWSLAGIKLKTFHRSIKKQEILDCQLSINFQEFYINFYTKIELIGVNKDKIR